MNNSATTNHQRGARDNNNRFAVGQRWSALLGGGVLAVYGLSRRSPLGLALAASGGALVFAGANVNQGKRTSPSTTSVIINASPQEVYNFWRNLENLPRFMRHLESVTVQDEHRSRWTVVGPMGARVRWTAEIINEQPGQSISWRSIPGSEIEVNGTVNFRPAPGNRGTMVEASVRYGSAAGKMGRIISKMFGKDPQFLMEQDLRRLKALMETGEIPTIDGQTHGPRAFTAAVARMVNPDDAYPRGVPMRELVNAERRVS
jgi:uncharacterized membrane protein